MHCQLSSASIHYQEYGEGKPILFFHALSLDYHSMSNMMEPLFADRTGWRRIYVDLPGMGESKAEQWMKSSDDVLSVILEFIEKIIPGDQFALAGLSYGGYIARGVAFKKMDRVNGMLLISPMIKAKPGDRLLPERVVLEKDDELLARLQKEEPTGFENFAVVQTEEILQKYVRDIYSGAQKSDRTFLTSEFRTKGYGYTFESEMPGTVFNKPVLLVLGRQDAVSGYQDAIRLIESYPRATISILDRAGHFPQLEQEKLIHCMVDEWLQRVEKEAELRQVVRGTER